ncbi:MAG TPA: biotin--[acetyl-CoA-carboxylase] ligase [Longimicrobiaceae bacterium]|nr:biotin--[acetyl-CoA-carboxylase] ligase [Longimicrobiaceae bacterium]
MAGAVTEAPLGRWEGEDAVGLARRWGSAGVHLFSSVGSTNDLARRLAAEGAPSGTVVLAEEQLAGRGQAGRAWSSPPGLGLWTSLVVRPSSIPDPAVLPLLVGLEAAAVLDPFAAPDAVAVKWPNDLYLRGRKLGGILCEGAWEGDRPSHFVVGLGLNVLHAPADFPPRIAARATSLRGEAGDGMVDRLAVASAVIPALLRRLSGEVVLTEADRAALAARDLLLGREVEVTEPATGAFLARGVAGGVSAEGALVVEGRPFRSGTVRLAEPA